MKKIGITIILICVLCWITPLHAGALTYESAEQSITQAMPNQAADLMQGVDASENTQGALVQLLENVYTEFAQTWNIALQSLAKILVIAVLCGTLSGFGAVGGDGLGLVQMAGALGITGVLCTDLTSLLSLCQQTANELSTFSAVMLPIMATAVAASGAPTTAVTLQVITLFVFDLLVRFLTCALIPAVCVYIAVITLNTALGNDLLGNLAGFIKWLIGGSLKLSLTIFMTYLTISGVMSGNADAVAVKTAKFAVSGVIPVVGSIISDASESILAGASLIRGTVGVLGMLCVLAICILPFLRVGCNYLLFKAGAAVISPICGKELAGLVTQLSDCFGLMLGMLGTCSLVIFLELVLSMMVGTT